MSFSSVPLLASAEPDNGPAIQVQRFVFPRYSDYLSSETRAGIERITALEARVSGLCDLSEQHTGPEIRACEAKRYPPLVAAARDVYDVHIEPKVINGIQTDIVTPADGVPYHNRKRVLINIHGGAFQYGARFGGQLEAMPIAALGKFKVVAVDYRMAPEHRFPAASVDVAAVYSELLKEYHASAIGIYGCSAGGRITGQMIGWLERQGLPRPGAIAVLCSPPTRRGGDSNVIVAALQGTEPRPLQNEYFADVNPGDVLAFPGDSDEMLKKFPPTLLMTSTRDYSLSPMAQMHSRLVRLGIRTELYVFEGLWHGEFFYNMYIPEAKQAAHVISRFFDENLASDGSVTTRR